MVIFVIRARYGGATVFDYPSLVIPRSRSLKVAKELLKDHIEEVKRDREHIDKTIGEIKAANASGAPPPTPGKLKASDEILFRTILLRTIGTLTPEAKPPAEA